jgi:hypothetical protein
MNKIITAILLFNILIITTIPMSAQLSQISETTTAGNITSSLKPQGASIGVQNESSSPEDKPNTDTVGNITSSLKPQGASIGVQNESSGPEDKPNTDTVGNITSSIKPQGTSIDNPT